MRNLLIHGYFDVDWDEVWNVTHNVRDFKHAAAEFGLRVLTPQMCLKEIRR